MLMPATHRRHFEPPWVGDGYHGIDVTARDHPDRHGLRPVDINWRWVWIDPDDHSKGGRAFAGHWGLPWENNWHYILDPGAKRARLLNAHERHLPDHAWTVAAYRRLRRSPDPKSARPVTYPALARYAVRHGVTIIGELKSDAFRLPLVMEWMVAAARRVGHPPWFMALFGSMRYCQQKCSSTIAAGGSFLVIFGRSVLQKRWRPVFAVQRHRWTVKPTRVGT